MKVSRLDLGAEVIYLPQREMLVIHPELDYAEALGAVLGTIPDIHPDAAVSLVDQVTPRPRPDRLGALRRTAVAVVLAIGVGVAGLIVNGNASPAQASFGSHFAKQMQALGLVCEDRHRGDNARVCVDSNRNVYKVKGFAGRNSDLYVLDRGFETVCILVFDTDVAARKYRLHNPRASLAGHVAVWRAGPHSDHRHGAHVSTASTG